MVWIVVFILIVFYFADWSNKTKSSFNAEVADEEEVEVKSDGISEEIVFKVQANFEERLEATYVPDAISGKEIYIYENLMKVWYEKLSNENRYNDVMIQRLRSDWLSYMEALEDRSTYNYLSMEAEQDSKEELFNREEHVLASRKAFAIEGAFSAAIGEKAISELAKIRKIDFWQFDRFGNLAPKGFMFDAEGELRPKKK